MFDSIIIGAGLAGLSTATELSSAGRKVLVLEARNRVGGRVENVVLSDGHVVEMGGQWVAWGHDEMRSLIAQEGLSLVEPNPGDMVLRFGGQVTKIHTEQPAAQDSLTPFEFSDVGQALLRLRRLADRVEENPTWAQANTRWLSQTFAQWTTGNLRTDGGRAYFTRLVQRALGISPEVTTLIDALHQVNRGVDLESFVAANGGLRQGRVRGGMAQVTSALAERLGDAVRLSSPVTSVRHDADHVVVEVEGGQTFEGRTVVVTVPPRLLKTITFDPPLPPERLELAEKVPAGNVIKAFLVYDHPWWRERGASGQMSADEGAVRITFDTSDDSDRGILLGFFEGAESSGYGKLSLTLRQRIFEEAVEKAFGKAPSKPLDYVDRDWLAEKYTAGCHGAHFAPGLWTASGPVLGQPLDRVLFAGAEYASTFNGYMEGAVRSAAATAGTVLEITS